MRYSELMLEATRSPLAAKLRREIIQARKSLDPDDFYEKTRIARASAALALLRFDPEGQLIVWRAERRDALAVQQLLGGEPVSVGIFWSTIKKTAKPYSYHGPSGLHSILLCASMKFTDEVWEDILKHHPVGEHEVQPQSGSSLVLQRMWVDGVEMSSPHLPRALDNV